MCGCEQRCIVQGSSPIELKRKRNLRNATLKRMMERHTRKNDEFVVRNRRFDVGSGLKEQHTRCIVRVVRCSCSLIAWLFNRCTPRTAVKDYHSLRSLLLPDVPRKTILGAARCGCQPFGVNDGLNNLSGKEQCGGGSGGGGGG